MKQFIEKLIGRLEEINHTDYGSIGSYESHVAVRDCLRDVKNIVNQLAEEYKQCTLCYLGSPCEYQNEKAMMPNELLADKNGWILCSERLPEVETKVLIHAKRKYRDGSFRDIITTAMYEDGTMLEDDSKWHWEDIEGEWDEENDCYFIPEGWWEDKMYNADGELNHAIDDEVIEWQPIPELCQLER